jgi:hypothetical protein
MARNSALKRMRERALLAAPDEVAVFPYDQLDVLVAEATIRGAKTLQELEDFCGAPAGTIKDRLLDPVRSAWIALQIEKAVGQRLGLINAALFHRAVSTGDPNAAKLLLTQYGKLVAEPAQRREIVDVRIDLSGLTTEELKRFAAEKARSLGLTQSTVIDVPAVVTEVPPSAE